MNLMLTVLAWFLGEGNCPSCDSKLYEHEGGYHFCKQCDSTVDFNRGCWSLPGGQLRRLPGIFGMAWDDNEAA